MARGIAAGSTEVTIVHKGVELVVPVHVDAPTPNEALVGETGGAISTPDGAVFALAPSSLEGEQLVKVTTVAEAELPIGMPRDFNFLAGYELQFDGDQLETPAQLAIPVAEHIAPGTQLYLFRYGHVPDETGTLQPIWWQDEIAVVGEDHVARTSSPPWTGVRPAGIWVLGEPGPGVTVARGVLTITFPIGIFPAMFTLAGSVASVAPLMAVSIDISELKIVTIPVQGLPVVTTVGVSLNPGVVNTVESVVTQPPDVLPKAPVLLGSRFEFRAFGEEVKPVVVLTGLNFSASPASSLSSRTLVQFRQQGVTVDAVAMGFPQQIGDGLEEIVVEVPRAVIVGIADFQVVRLDQVIELGPCTGEYVHAERAFVSNPMHLQPEANYVTAAMRTSNRVVVFTQGDPAADDPPSELDEVAQIPVGVSPRATAVTSDHARVYVTNTGDRSEGSATVSVIDLLALQEVDTQPGNGGSSGPDPLDRIVLPDGARPFQITLDPDERYAYVGDEAQGAIYVIDIDPASPEFHRHVYTIALPWSATQIGLRGAPALARRREAVGWVSVGNGRGQPREPHLALGDSALDGPQQPGLELVQALLAIAQLHAGAAARQTMSQHRELALFEREPAPSALRELLLDECEALAPFLLVGHGELCGL